MRTCYILEYKEIDSKGREKNARHVGVFSTLETLEEMKKVIQDKTEKNLSFHVHTSQSWI
ncbi:MAG: hypothetical protein VW262_09155 [Flavobacteriaceae bacterium]